MTAILGVHGIAQQQLGPNQLLKAWEPALRDGIELAVGKPARKEFRAELEIAFYGHLFLQSGGLSKGPDGGRVLADDEVAYFKEIERDCANDIETTKGIKEMPPSVGRLVTWLDSRFGVAASGLFIGELRQVRRYQLDHSFAEEVRGRVLELLDGFEIVIGHSLGSVVALETLALNPGNGVRRLVTLGSPLALPTVQRRLRGDPGSLSCTWNNIYDRSDPVACAGGLAAAWPRAVDVTVDNQANPHAVERYLTKAETGEAITGRTRLGR